MSYFPKTVFSLFVALTGTIASGYAKENQNNFQKYLITERDNIELNFSEPIFIREGNINIHRADDDSIFETIDVTSSQVNGSSTNKITINPLLDFCSSTKYYLTIDSTAFDDEFGNSFGGINDKTSFTFETLDTISPTIKDFSETIVAGSRNIILNFSEPVDVEKGKIVIYKRSDDSIVETIDVRSSQVNGTNTNQITITPRARLAAFTEYYLKIDSLAFDDQSGNSYKGLEDSKSISFYTGATESISDLDSNAAIFSSFYGDDLNEDSYSNDSDLVAEDGNITLEFSEPIYIKQGNIVIYKSEDNSIFETIDVKGPQVTGSRTKKITINPSRNFSSSTNYYLKIDANAFDDAYGNSFEGINDTTSYSFTTSDTIAPKLKLRSTSQLRDTTSPTLKLSRTPQLRDTTSPTLKLSRSPQLRDTTSPTLKLSRTPQFRDPISPISKLNNISGINNYRNLISSTPRSTDDKTPFKSSRSILIYKKQESSSSNTNLTSNIKNSSSNTTLNTFIPIKDNFIDKRKEFNLSEFTNNSFMETDRKDLAFIPSKTSPLTLGLSPLTEKRTSFEEKSNIPIYIKPDEINIETKDLSNREIKGKNSSQIIVAPTTELYAKNVLDKIELLKDQTKNEILKDNDFFSTDIREKEPKLVQFENLEKIIKEKSHELKIMESRIEEARQMMKGTVSAWSPILNLSSTGLPQYTKGKTYHSLAPNKSTNQKKASLQATIKWDLINPSRTPQINNAKANLENARIAYSLRHRDLLLEAKLRFLQLQHSLQDVRIAEDSINISKAALDQSLERMESGTGTKFDVLEANTQLSKDRQLLAEKQGNKKMNEIRLVQILNMNQNTVPSVESQPYIIGEWKTSLEDSIDSAYENRKEIDDLQLKISVHKNKSKLELAKTKPTVSLFNLFEADIAEGESNSLSPQTNNKSNSTNNTVGLQFDWKIFDGGSSKAYSKAKDAKINEIKEQVLFEKSKVRKEVEQLFTKLEKSRLNIEHSYAAILSAKESLELSLLRQQSGLGVQREVLNSKRDLTQAEITHAKAINEYNISLVNLQILTGLEA